MTVKNPTTAKTVQKQLQDNLNHIAPLKKCALLNYPNHINLGDHLIWLGNLSYLRNVLNTEIGYTASSPEFSAVDMEDCVGKAPILLHGGGSLGDIWYSHQKFRESIIRRYRDRPIVILPQTIHFQDPAKLDQAAHIFNDHPHLTIFARDHVSHGIAQSAFHNCQVWMAPDTAFQLSFLAQFPTPKPQDKILYHCRSDAELLTQVTLKNLPLPFDVADWRPYNDHWLMGAHDAPLKQAVATIIREGWQRGIKHPQEWRSCQRWNHEFRPDFIDSTIHNPELQSLSWNFTHSAVYQFRQYKLIITNRLHGHILATLLGIPHIFLSNNYHKNQSFYETWTMGLPYSKFVSDLKQIPDAATELLHQAG